MNVNRISLSLGRTASFALALGLLGAAVAAPVLADNTPSTSAAQVTPVTVRTASVAAPLQLPAKAIVKALSASSQAGSPASPAVKAKATARRRSWKRSFNLRYSNPALWMNQMISGSTAVR